MSSMFGILLPKINYFLLVSNNWKQCCRRTVYLYFDHIGKYGQSGHVSVS